MVTSRNNMFSKGCNYRSLLVAAAILCGASAAQAALPSGYTELQYFSMSGNGAANNSTTPLKFWLDTGFTPTKAQSNELYDMVRRLQPGCLINSRIGCGKCDYTSSGDNEIPSDDKSGMLYETCATINDSWGYKPTDQGWKSADVIRANREHLRKIGANYLLNVGPDALGRIPARSADILRAARA